MPHRLEYFDLPCHPLQIVVILDPLLLEYLDSHCTSVSLTFLASQDVECFPRLAKGAFAEGSTHDVMADILCFLFLLGDSLVPALRSPCVGTAASQTDRAHLKLY